MKKGIFIGISVFVLVVLVLVYIYSSDEEVKEVKLSGFSDEQILNIVKGDVRAYCDLLDEKAIYSYCSSCGGSYSGELFDDNYLYVGDFSEGQRERYKYTIVEKDKLYFVEFQIPIIAGRSTRPAGNAFLNFTLSENGTVLNKNIPTVKECSL